MYYSCQQRGFTSAVIADNHIHPWMQVYFKPFKTSEILNNDLVQFHSGHLSICIFHAIAWLIHIAQLYHSLRDMSTFHSWKGTAAIYGNTDILHFYFEFSPMPAKFTSENLQFFRIYAIM
jgi:hypothetical protein